MKTPRCFIGNRFFSLVRTTSAGTLISAAAAMALFAASPGSPTISGTGMSIGAPDDVATTSLPITPVCTTPSPVHTYAWYHCYTPIDIRTAYGVTSIADPTTGNGSGKTLGQGQTIVLVDAYGSPTAASDLQFFHDTFYPTLPT